ncbi:PTS cellobiose transporter subunit IIC [Vagococcus salmoninarum]
MNEFMDKLQDKLGPIAHKLDANRYLKAVKNGFFAAMPLLIIGSMFLLVTQLPFDGYLNFMESLLGAEWKQYFSKVNDMTMNLMTIFVILGMSKTLASSYKVDQVSAQVMSLLAFFILTPIVMTVDEAKALPIGNFGAAGLFVGMITAILAVELFRLVVARGWVIKMPDSVPSNVSQSFSALIPGFIIAIVFNLIRILFAMTAFETAHNFILQFLQTPLLKLGSSLPATIVVVLFEALLWAFGIHGSNVTGAVTTPIWTALSVENAAAFEAGLNLPNIVNYQFYMNFVKIGGSSATIGLAIACLFFAKSTQFKTLGKLSFGPALFNINEPLIFGIPIVLNPIMLIPFMIAPLVMVVLSYTAMATGIVPITNGIQLPWTMPILLSGFILSGWKGVILQTIQIGLSFVIYYPFFKVEDTKAYEIETHGLG